MARAKAKSGGGGKKSPPELIARFDAAIARHPGVERRQMFGYPCAFLNGQMTTGLFQDGMMLRLSEADRTRAARELGATPFEPMKGRPMREYVALPKEVVADSATLDAWLDRAVDWVRTLPAKSNKPKKPAPAKRTAR